jgi:hypothetical protein
MASCYRCGRHIGGSQYRPRRRVKTGESVRFSYPRRRIKSRQLNFGMRIVCGKCAATIDRERQMQLLIGRLQLLAVAILAYLILLLMIVLNY